MIPAVEKERKKEVAGEFRAETVLVLRVGLSTRRPKKRRQLTRFSTRCSNRTRRVYRDKPHTRDVRDSLAGIESSHQKILWCVWLGPFDDYPCQRADNGELPKKRRQLSQRLNSTHRHLMGISGHRSSSAINVPDMKQASSVHASGSSGGSGSDQATIAVGNEPTTKANHGRNGTNCRRADQLSSPPDAYIATTLTPSSTAVTG